MVQGTQQANAPRSGGRRGDISPQAVPPARRSYQPIVIHRPSTGQVILTSLVDTAKSVTFLIVSLGIMVGAGMGIAIVLTSILKAIGVDMSDSY